MRQFFVGASALLALAAPIAAQTLPPAVTLTKSGAVGTASPIVLCDATAGPVVVSLPKPRADVAMQVTIIKIDSTENGCTVDAPVSGVPVEVKHKGGALTVVSSAKQWWQR